MIKTAYQGTISGIGRRENMEDYLLIHPCHSSNESTVLIVCDGMGGNEKGEVASKLAGEAFMTNLCRNEAFQKFSLHQSNFIDERTGNEVIRFLEDAFSKVQEEFDEYLSLNPGSAGMGTTAVVALLINNSVAVLHCGDSRLYHVRNGRCLWHTSDHSLVMEWVQQGRITEAEAAVHPRKNIITRAIQGNMVHIVKPDVHLINDILSGDYFFLATDGVREGVPDDELFEILGSDKGEDDKLNIITERCTLNSRDNFSAVLVKVNCE